VSQITVRWSYFGVLTTICVACEQEQEQQQQPEYGGLQSIVRV
jgi:hypothetical protein